MGISTEMRIHAVKNQQSILGTCVKAIGRALDAAGCNGPALLAEAGFDLKELDGPDTRCPLVKIGDLWRIALAATRRSDFRIEAHQTVQAHHVSRAGLRPERELDVEGKLSNGCSAFRMW